MHDYMWPETVWHYWTERRFREHCENWSCITYAGGGSTTKSFDAAKIGILFWLINPKERAVVVASTSLASLSSRIWGYIIKHLNKSALYHPITQLGGQAPKVLYDYKKEKKKTKDEIHGMFAIAAKQGDDETTISSWIGRHPDDALMLILDEATDMPPALIKAVPNLEQGVNFFQLMAIGNSNSQFDLHGALSTPKDGWDSIDPNVNNKWETTQKNGICLFFSCYESPAIYETDPVRKEKLSKFLITAEAIAEKEALYGKDSDSFSRFVHGFWRSETVEETVISRKFIKDFNVFESVEWSGLYPLAVVAGLDPAFSTGGDQCLLRLAVLGVASNGQIVLDFRRGDLVFPIQILALPNKSADLQIAEQVLHIMKMYRVNMRDLCIDATGQGRSLGEVIKFQGESLVPPLKVWAVKGGTNIKKDNFDIVIKNAYELWFDFRDFIQHKQIRGMDFKAAEQLTTRLIVKKGSKRELESKADFKTRMSAVSPRLAHSPDEADSAALCLQAAIINYGFSPGQKRDVVSHNSFADDKYSAYKQITNPGTNVGQPQTDTRPAPPVATFGTDISAAIGTKDRFSNF